MSRLLAVSAMRNTSSLRLCLITPSNRVTPSVVRCLGSKGLDSDYSISQEFNHDHRHCVDIVQQRDREGYLCGLLMPSSARKSYFAIRAFNVELASIKDGGERRRAASGAGIEGSSLARRMRMQWWRDALEQIYLDRDLVLGPNAPHHLHNPVVRALHHAVHESRLTRRFLERMLTAREIDLDVTQTETLEDLILYGQATHAGLLYLSLECAGVRDERADAVATNLGIAIGLATALRSVAYRATLGEVAIPADVMAKHNVSSQLLLRTSPQQEGSGKEGEENLKSAVQEMARVALAYYHEARDEQYSVPKAGRPCLLPAVSSIQYLEKLEMVDFDVNHSSLHDKERHRFSLMLLLARTWFTGVL